MKHILLSRYSMIYRFIDAGIKSSWLSVYGYNLSDQGVPLKLSGWWITFRDEREWGNAGRRLSKPVRYWNER